MIDVPMPESTNPSIQIAQFATNALSGLSMEDRRLFELFGKGPAVAPSHLNIYEAFRDQAQRYPDAIAIRHLEHMITYRSLTLQVERLAAHLQKHGVKRGDHVGLFVYRSIPMVVGILATLKLGAAYVPQDARIVPAVQLHHVVEVASTRVILTLASVRHLIPIPQNHVCIAIDEFLSGTLEDHSPMVHENALPDDNCFVLFTSGTTGAPNGVQVTHRNLCNIILTDPGRLGMKHGRLVSQILNISFDMAAWEILGALSHGATLVIRGQDIQETVERVDVVIATPSILASLDADRCRNVKVAAVAGEPCSHMLAKKWASFCTFYNSCGPTEVTIVNTMLNYENADQSLTIGKPTPNNTVYILNDDLSPCAIGEIGEMWAGGDCVTRGYLGNDALNRERYRPDPFLGGERKMFRTRDLGRWTANGELEHFGRTDDQVKIKGFRVELDSISRILEKVDRCEQAVTLKLDSRTLVAFVKPKAVNLDEAKEAITKALPYYCHPKALISLDELPVTSRGKIDKRALTVLAVKSQEGLKTKAENTVTS